MSANRIESRLFRRLVEAADLRVVWPNLREVHASDDSDAIRVLRGGDATLAGVRHPPADLLDVRG